MAEPQEVAVTEEGTDLHSEDGKFDAHIRAEKDPEGVHQITVDVFDSRVRDNNRAHVDSELFDNTNQGAADAEDYLLGYGFRYRVREMRGPGGVAL